MVWKLGMKTLDCFARYLEGIAGVAPAIRPLADGDVARVPLFITTAYRLFATNLFGRRFVLAVQVEGQAVATPTAYAKHASLIRTALQGEVALVLSGMPAYVRNRLVQQGVPFVVPGRQLFLPPLAVDLKERHARPVREGRQELSAPAQLVVIHHLMGKPEAGRTLKELADVLGYSAMTITNAGEELQRAGVCEVVRSGRTCRLQFDGTPKTIWQQALPLLQSPVRFKRWVRRCRIPPADRLAAGLTALDVCTMISDDPVPTFALWQNEYRQCLRRADFVECQGGDEAEAMLECWRYDPKRLTGGNCVDRFSLYLSLRQSTDERVQKALTALMEGVP
jgi:hypothetical protein